MTSSEEQREKLDRAEEILDYSFGHKELLLAAITHPSATEGKSVKFSYERLEFLGDSILGAIVATVAFHRFHDLDEGGLTRIKVALVSGTSLSDVAAELGFADIIVFGSSETGTGKRGLHSALENVYEAIVAALYLDGGLETATAFVERTLIPRMSLDMAKEPENPKSALQEKLQEDGITPTYKLVETQGPPHDRTFVAQVFAGTQGLARGTGRTKKEAESQAAKSTLARLRRLFRFGSRCESGPYRKSRCESGAGCCEGRGQSAQEKRARSRQAEQTEQAKPKEKPGVKRRVFKIPCPQRIQVLCR